MTEGELGAVGERTPTAPLVDRDKQYEVGKLFGGSVRCRRALISFVAETTIREANSNIWGNHIVAGLGSLTRSSV